MMEEFYQLMATRPMGPFELMREAAAARAEQLRRDKKSIYEHPLFPLLATVYGHVLDADVNMGIDMHRVNGDIRRFVESAKHQGTIPCTGDAEADKLVLNAIRVLHFHLMELAKVEELADQFATRYISCLLGKMPICLVQDQDADAVINKSSEEEDAEIGQGVEESTVKDSAERDVHEEEEEKGDVENSEGVKEVKIEENTEKIEEKEVNVEAMISEAIKEIRIEENAEKIEKDSDAVEIEEAFQVVDADETAQDEDEHVVEGQQGQTCALS